MLLRVVTELQRQAFEQSVIQLGAGTDLEAALRDVCGPAHSLRMRPTVPSLPAFFRLVPLIRRAAPDIIQGWMYHGNIAATLAAFWATSRIPVAWNVRQTLYQDQRERFTTSVVIRAGSLLSRLPLTRPQAIIFNSSLAREQHLTRGYRGGIIRTIPNGLDLLHFAPNPERRQPKRASHGIRSDEFVVVHIAHYRPMKDHETLLSAISLATQQMPNLRVLLAGKGVSTENPSLVRLIERYQVQTAATPVGYQDDIRELLAAADTLVLSSKWGEGFPNVLVEAMAFGVPCIATDVGECSNIIGDTGTIVPPADAQALAKAILGMARLEPAKRQELAATSRSRAEQHFDIREMAKRYAELYHELLKLRPPQAMDR